MNALARLLPQPGDEAFKYTSFAPLARREYRAAAPVAVDESALPAPFGRRILFVDGNVGATPAVGATLRSRNVGATLWSRQSRLQAPSDAHALRRMNTELASECIHLDIPADTDAGVIELLFVATDHPDRVASYPQVKVTVGAHAKVTLIERHHALGDAEDFTNLVTEIDVQRGANATHLLLQQAGSKATLATGVYASIAENGCFESHAAQLGGQLVRTDIHAKIEGRGARCALYGLHVPGMKQHIDTRTRIDHLVRDTSSDEHYRAIVDRGGRSVFNGKVYVAEGADGTDAQQYNGNLLLDEKAEADTKPELEIYADDVKASHGATVGKLDETALFYLRSRGIGLDAARSVLTWAFADTVLTKLPVADAREAFEAAVLNRLPESALIREFR